MSTGVGRADTNIRSVMTYFAPVLNAPPTRVDDVKAISMCFGGDGGVVVEVNILPADAKILSADAKILPGEEAKLLPRDEAAKFLPGEEAKILPEEEAKIQPRSFSCGTSSVTLQAGQSVPLTSPNYPYAYPSPLYCRWIAQAPINTVIRVYCPIFNVYSSPLCQMDRLTISQNGLDNLSDGISYCGGGYIDVTLNSNRFVATFITSVKIFPYRNNGFSCILTAMARSGTTRPRPPTSSPQTGQCGLKNPSRIVNGQDAGQNEWPWQAAVRNKVINALFCGGVLIADRWVVTAAHCAAHYPMDQIYVTLGDHWRDPTRPTRFTITAQVSKVIIHEAYDRQTVNNDIALLELSEAVTYSNGVKPICLPCSVTPQKLEGQNGIVTGWGATSSGGSFSEVLQEVELPLMFTADCQGYLGNVVTSNMICTYKHNHDACQGDSGGPLAWKGEDGRYYLVGVVSWGYGCAGVDTPGVYAKVTHYLAWIQIKTGITVCP